VDEPLESLLYEHFIEPTRHVEQSYAGVEIELPLVNLRRAPVDFSVVHALNAAFSAHFGFEVTDRDDDGEATQLTCPALGDVLTYDCSYNNLEISFARAGDLLALRRRFEDYYRFIRAELLRSDHTTTGMGINPHRGYNRFEPVPNGRYRMLYHFLRRCDEVERAEATDAVTGVGASAQAGTGAQGSPGSPPAGAHTVRRFHPWPEFGMFSSASQVQIDVPTGRLLKTLDAFERLEPFKAVLFANSVLRDGGTGCGIGTGGSGEADAGIGAGGGTGTKTTWLCARDMLWERSMQGYNPLNVGMSVRTPQSIGELLAFLGSLSIFCTERDGRYLDFVPVPFAEYLGREQVVGSFFDENAGGFREMAFAPAPADIAYLRSYRHCDLTFRGTVEFRSCCTQPIADTFSVAAFHLGLIEDVDALAELLDADRSLYGHGPAAPELRRLMVLWPWPGFVDRAALREQLLAILDLASAGLRARGLGEERLLDALYLRAQQLSNPAQELLAKLGQGISLEALIHAYAEP
jgi:gamma-glutamylcysteine synthetase